MFPEIRRVVRRIPRGRVATYGSVAEAAGFPGRARQVAWALRESGGNGLCWHRVVGAGGRILLGGHAGAEQKIRLQAEGVPFRGNRVWIERCGFEFGESSRRR